MKRTSKSVAIKSNISLADPRHLMRFLKREAGNTELDIAKSEGVSVQTVRHSLRAVETYRNANSGIEMDLAVRSVVIETAPRFKQTISRLLDAQEFVTMKDPKTGKDKVFEVDDKTTQTEAARVYKELVIGLQPKQAPVEVNVNQTTQIANLSKAETTEERLRRLRAKAAEANLLPPEVAAVPASLDRDEDDDDGDDEEEDEEDE